MTTALLKLLVGVVLIITVTQEAEGLKCYQCATLSGLGQTSCEKKKDLKDEFLVDCDDGVCAKGVLKLDRTAGKGILRGCMPLALIKPSDIGKCQDFKLEDNMDMLRLLFQFLGIDREPDPPGSDAKATTCYCDTGDGCNSSTKNAPGLILIAFLSFSFIGMRLLIK